MFDDVHEQIIKRWNWATGPAIEFYRLVSLKLDMSILYDDDFDPQAKSGIAKAGDYIIHKCVDELGKHDDWNSLRIRCVIDFVLKAFEKGSNLITAQQVSHLLLKMVESWNILVNSTNIIVFADFFRDTVSDIQTFGLYDELKLILGRIKALPKQMTLNDEQLQTISGVLDEFKLLHQAQPQAHTNEPRIELNPRHRGLEILHEEPDWCCTEIATLTGTICAKMQIGASCEIRNEAGAVIEAMVKSDKLFFLDTNLMILRRFSRTCWACY
ncbi:hypothetical protein FB567DRAFT_228215 [Paraphoma chrysanthemicola]|uniref:Uncharacterized protein n=1 Tax=Paraphoma chrysanthemicola TaxID=798071 RepID=A0A8K0RG21_9PLEO|nr:hypothetical protein FB567DRAFT_228215 [Paraphoma chrysanthemicola]